ncbi:uncharacterized protein LOC108850234 [Raphanus sativus]|uniref:Uncharacterized protein LOC108850234 n=1 Tax=Raphanus sativus TaxID=3726 RepID=A0A6J0N5G6_RAPSA|nr:uncharacterized protein LOC108850234 [Raphanus sativus]
MANPWFPSNSASALSPSLLTPGDSRLLAPPDPPDLDPNNPLSLAHSASKSSCPSFTPSLSVGMSKNSTSVASRSTFSGSRNTVHEPLNFKILPPKSSSPIQTNRASSSAPPPPNSLRPSQNPVLPSNPNPKINPSLPSDPASTPSLNPSIVSNHALNPAPASLNPYSSTSLPSSAPSIAEKIRKSVDKSLRRRAPISSSESGRPRVFIPESVFQKGAELHKDFIICYFNGRPPPFKHIQNVLNSLWGKGSRVEIHSNPLSRSMLVRIPSDYLRLKILEKRVWYIGDSMFQAVQWTSTASSSSPPLQSIQIWAHLQGIPLDLRHEEGLSLIAGLVGEPKETDDFTLNLVSLTMSHVKVAVDLTHPLPTVVEFTRQSGDVVEVAVSYPWVPPTCSHCKELGHIMKNCLLLPPPEKQNTQKQKGKAPASSATPSKNQSTPKPKEKDSVNLASSSAAPSPAPPPVPPLNPLPSQKPLPFVPPPSPPPKLSPSPPLLPLPNPPPTPPSLPLSIPPQLSFSSPPSPPDYPKKRPRPSSSQSYPSFTAQLNSFSTPQLLFGPLPLPALPPPPSSSFDSNPFAILATHGPLPREEVID